MLKLPDLYQVLLTTLMVYYLLASAMEVLKSIELKSNKAEERNHQIHGWEQIQEVYQLKEKMKCLKGPKYNPIQQAELQPSHFKNRNGVLLQQS